MTGKEIAEIRRRIKPEKNNIREIHGCYVNDCREIIATFELPTGMTEEEELLKYYAFLKKVLSGQPGRNLIDIEFSTKQVMEGEQHKRLIALRDSELRDAELLREFYELIITSLRLEGNYLILIAFDTYDVPKRNGNDEDLEESEDMFSYMLCSVCPVKPTKPALKFDFSEQLFNSLKESWIVSSPKLGFMFPTFDDRASNIYNVLYYTQDAADSHTELTDAVFGTEMPMPAAEQQDSFNSILCEALEEQCSYDVVQTVHEQLCGIIEAHKESKTDEPLAVSKRAVDTVLESCGVSEEHIETFDRRFDETFGDDADITPTNVVNSKRFQLKTPDVVITVNPQRRDLIDTRVIDGRKYILIAADEGVEVNGISVCIDDAEDSAEK